MIRVSAVDADMSSTSRSHGFTGATRRPTGVVDVSTLTAAELRRFAADYPGEVAIQRRGGSAFLLAE